MSKRPHGFKARSDAASVPSRDYGPPKKHKQWIETSMIRAMEAEKSGEISANKAAKEVDVPLTTLKDRISGRVRHGRNPGAEPYLNQDEESSLAIFLITACKMGHCKTKQDVIHIVKRKVKKKNPGRNINGFKGEGWWQGFMKRHSELSLRSSDPLSSCRSNAVTKDSLDCYYSLLKEPLEGNNLMNKSTCIYNMDETGMPLDSKQLKRIAPRGLKKVYSPSSGNKTQITVCHVQML